MNETLTESDIGFLTRAIEWSEKGVAAGERPFGAMIVGPDGTVLSEAHGVGNAAKDVTAHAEVTVIRMLAGKYDRETLSRSTLYSSTEPCAMCAGAIFWAHIGRLVFGLSEERLRPVRNAVEPTALEMKAAAVLATGGYPTVVLGPALEEEALDPHRKFWV